VISYNPHDSYDAGIGHLTIVTLVLLSREMDDIFQDLVHASPGSLPPSPYFDMAEAANSIVVRCRHLVRDIRRYEHFNHLRKQQEDKPPDPDAPGGENHPW
jgi:hypothetical protein